MKQNHIINLLESVPFASLSESDHREIRAHAANCHACAHAYRAAVVSTSLLKEGAGEVFEPSPFFQTRVLAAIREQQSEARGLTRLWRAAGALVSSLAATVALLAVLSFMIPATQSTAEASAFNVYSAEEVILDQTEIAQGQVSDAEVLSTLYQSDEDER
jgi:anti-sigma factor RsiW